jgi:hypothetical protein
MRKKFRRNIVQQTIKYMTVLGSQTDLSILSNNISVYFKAINKADLPVVVSDVVSCPTEFWYFYQQLN